MTAAGDGGTPRVAPLALIATAVMLALGLLPIANWLTGRTYVAWYRHEVLYWLLVGGALVAITLLLCRFAARFVERTLTAGTALLLDSPTPLFLFATSAFALLASATIATICFGRQPHNADEVAQLWHMKILLSGRLSLPADANPEFFAVDNMIDHARWYSQFPVGGPALLALGGVLDAAWLVNPVLFALTVPALYAAGRRMYGEATGRGAALLLVLSPFALFMAASFMNHMGVFFLSTLALASLAAWTGQTERASLRAAATAIGLVLGLAFTIRPLDAVLVAGVIGAAQMARLTTSAAHRRSLLWQFGAGLLPVAVLALVHVRTTGAPFRFGYEVLYGGAHELGFHRDPYGNVHTPARALLYAAQYLLQLNVSLFQWPMPAALVICAGWLALRRTSRWDRVLFAVIGVQLAGYALYWHEGEFRGPRFIFTALSAFIIFAARAPVLIAARNGPGTASRAARLIMPLCVVVAWWPWGPASAAMAGVKQYRKLSATSSVNPDSVVRAAGLHRALVFVSERWATRLTRQLWALEMPRAQAMRLMFSGDLCAVSQAIATERARVPATPTGRLDRLAQSVLHQTPNATALADCSRERTSDADGMESYGPFLPANPIDHNGHVDGDIIYVIDLGAHNDVLRQRFADRIWYRYGPHATRGDPRSSLTLYDQ